MDEEQRRKEDEELIRRLAAAPVRHCFQINVGPQTPKQVDRYLRDFRKRFKGPDGGSFKNPLDPKDDLFPKD